MHRPNNMSGYENDLGRTLPLCSVFAPSVTKELEDSIVGGGKSILRRAASNLLEQFCRIAESPNTNAAVATFAKRWGVLGLCEHGLPYSHDFCMPGRAELFEHWKCLAVAFAAMVRLGKNLSHRYTVDPTDWELAVQGIFRDDDAEHLGECIAKFQGDTGSVRLARECYAILVRRLIGISLLQPRFQWDGGVWNISLDSEACRPEVEAHSNLPALLTAQLMSRVCYGESQIQCVACRRWVIPKRNQRKYCRRCGIRAAWRDSKRKQ
jgi:hypothetical protein